MYIYIMKYITVFVCRFVFLPKSHISFGNAEPSRMRYHQSSAPCPSRPFPLASGIRRLRRSGWRTASKISSWAGNFWISEKMQDSWFFAELGGSVFFGLCSLTSINSQHQGLLKCCFWVFVVAVGSHSLGLGVVCLVWPSLKLERTWKGTLEACGWVLSPRYDGLELDLKIIWNCNADIVVDVQGIEIGIENVHIDGVLAELS